MNKFLDPAPHKKQTILSAKMPLDKTNSLANVKVDTSVNKSEVDQRKAEAPKRRKRRLASKVYGAAEQTPMDKQSTKVTTEDSEIVKVRLQPPSSKTLEPSEEEKRDAIQKQKQIIAEQSKNIQNDIYLRKQEDIDVSPSLHVIH